MRQLKSFSKHSPTFAQSAAISSRSVSTFSRRQSTSPSFAMSRLTNSMSLAGWPSKLDLPTWPAGHSSGRVIMRTGWLFGVRCPLSVVRSQPAMPFTARASPCNWLPVVRSQTSTSSIESWSVVRGGLILDRPSCPSSLERQCAIGGAGLNIFHRLGLEAGCLDFQRVTAVAQCREAESPGGVSVDRARTGGG